MTKLENPQIKTKDRSLEEHSEEIVTLWNLGKISFSASASSGPSDTPSDIEFRVWQSGVGVAQLLIFVPGSVSGGSTVGWWKLAATAI